MRKIFCIGFNKTATTSLHNAFLDANIKSTHNTDWPRHSIRHDKIKFKWYDAYSDGQFSDYVWLKKTFPKARFILNTRNLKSWLISRYNHNNRHDKKLLTNDIIKKWIINRNTYHFNAINFFGKNLLVVDVLKEGNRKINKQLSHFIHKSIKIGLEFRRSTTKRYIHHVPIINKALEHFKITDSECDKLFISRLLK